MHWFVGTALLSLFPGILCGQGVTVRLEPDQEESGPGATVSVSCRLENPGGIGLVAYQVYLGYDASVMRSEGVVWSEGPVLGDETFAAGIFDGRDNVLFSAWRDGEGTDVVSASGLLVGTAPHTSGGLLCVFQFQILEGSSGVATFRVDPGPYWSFSGFFDATGASVPVKWVFGSVKLRPVPPVAHVACQCEGKAVTVSWDQPASAVEAIEVTRNGEPVGRVSGTERLFRDLNPPLGEHTYGVATLVGDERGPAVTCSVWVRLSGPIGLACNFNGTAVELRWSIPNVYSYIEIRRNGRFLVRLPGAAIEHDDEDGLQGQTKLDYAVYGVIGGHKSAEASCTADLSTGGGIFLRGDANVDGLRVLSDAVVILGYLFSGGALPCLDAADFDDDGRLRLSDAVGLLSWLFVKGTPPPPPHEAPGPDPTSDNLSCQKGLPVE